MAEVGLPATLQSLKGSGCRILVKSHEVQHCGRARRAMIQSHRTGDATLE